MRANTPNSVEVLQNFILRDLRWWPVAFRTFFKIIQTVWSVLVSETYSLTWACSEDDAATLHADVYNSFLTCRNDRQCKMVRELPPWAKADNQSDESWSEQRRAMKIIETHLYPLLSLPCLSLESLPLIPPLLITGPPGSGKTFLLQSTCRLVSTASTSPNWEITTLIAHRSCVISGLHIHLLCHFRSYQGRPSASSLVKSGLDYLRNHPEERRILQELHILFVDEFGQVGARLLSAMNILFRLLRKNDSLFGGVAVLVCGDHYQNRPVVCNCTVSLFLHQSSDNVPSTCRPQATAAH